MQNILQAKIMCASGEQEMIESFAERKALGFRPALREGERLAFCA